MTHPTRDQWSELDDAGVARLKVLAEALAMYSQFGGALINQTDAGRASLDLKEALSLIQSARQEGWQDFAAQYLAAFETPPHSDGGKTPAQPGEGEDR